MKERRHPSLALGLPAVNQEKANANAEPTTTIVKATPTTAFFQPKVCSMITPPEIIVLHPNWAEADYHRSAARTMHCGPKG
jgi:hypothetical protein